MSLSEFWDEVIQKLKLPIALGSRSYEPVYYLVYDPSRTREIRQEIPSFLARLRQEGLTPIELDFHKLIWEILENDPDWLDIRDAIRSEPDNENDLMDTIREMVNGYGDPLVSRIAKTIEDASSDMDKHPVVIITGLEVLHGITRPGTIENRLVGHFSCPTVFFYPGKQEGKTGLAFLNFHPLDGNYRSEHIVIPTASNR